MFKTMPPAHAAFMATLAILFSVGVSHNALAAASYVYSPQLVMTGANVIQQTDGDLGKGIVFGDIDTGITPNWVGFTSAYNGQGLSNINIMQSATCLNTSNSLNGVCSGALPTDGNGHGTFTASEMVGAVPSAGYYSYDPAATLIAVQVLSASGSGYSNDVANGIVYAANHGAQILNLSLGPSGTASQQAAFYESIASAVNYAAAKGVFVVFAGGNASQAFSGGADITGFTNAALSHMLFMGSTNANENLSYFSNTPGTGYFLSTTGQKVNYDSMWLMADGENIWGASNSNSGQCRGYGCITQDSGTSMAAPQGAGAIGLLLAEWPILGKNGTATAVLEATGTNMGSNTTYGDGFLNLVNAFQPIGTLTVMGTNGQSIVVGSGGGAVLTSGALGDVASVKSILSNYTAFDSFQRNFTLNLSNLIVTQSPSSPAAQTISAPKSVVSGTHFADGSSLAFGSTVDDSPSVGRANADDKGWFMSLTDASGSTMAAGAGFPASASFAGALWGTDNPVSGEVSSLGVSDSLLGLAEGGNFAAFGTRLDGSVRAAFSWSETDNNDSSMTASTLSPRATAFGSGISGQMTQDWMAGVTFGMLDEQNGLLGSTYTATGPISFGDNHQSMSMGITSAFALGGKLDLLLDAAIVRTDAAQMDEGIVSGVSSLYARTYGASLVQRDEFKDGDNLSFTARAPLRVYSGSATMAMTSVDGNGNPITGSQRVNLTPTGNEMDFSAGYQQPINESMSWNMTVDAIHDDGNVAGASSADFLLGGKLTF